MDVVDLISKIAPVIVSVLSLLIGAAAGVAVGYHRLRKLEVVVVQMKIRRQEDYEKLTTLIEDTEKSVDELKDEVRSWIYNVSDGGAARYVSVNACQHEQAACYRNIALQFNVMEKKFDRIDDLLTQLINIRKEEYRGKP